MREHHPDALPGDQDGRERQEQPVAKPQELRLIDGQQVRDRLLDRWQEVELHDFSDASPTVGARFAAHRPRQPRTPRSRPCDPARSRAACSSRRLGVAVALGINQQLLDERGEQLAARLSLSGADQDGATNLVQHRRGALLVRWVDDLRFKRIDRRQFLRAAVQPEVAGVVGGCHRHRVGEFHRGQAARNGPRQRQVSACRAGLSRSPRDG